VHGHRVLDGPQQGTPGRNDVVVGMTVAGVAHGSAVGAATTPDPASPHGMGLPVVTGLKPRPAPLGASLAAPAEALPASVDLSASTVPVGDQGTLSSCVSWAIAHAMLGWYSNQDRRPGQPFAPMYLYSQINSGRDGGAWPSDAFNVLATQGNDTQADYQLGNYDWWDQPTAAEKLNAAKFRTVGHRVVFDGRATSESVSAPGQAAIQAELAAGRPVAIGTSVRSTFQTWNNTSALFNDTTSPVVGAHEMLAVGYNQDGLLVQNSWGTTWGNRGFARISWSTVQKDVYLADVIDGFATTRASHDLTGDGKNDMTVSSGGAMTVFKGDNSGGFPSTQSLGTGWNYFNTVLVPGDMTDDGVTEMIGRAAADGSLWLCKGNGNRTFATAVKISQGGNFNSLNALVSVGDFNSDGRADILARLASDGSLWYYPGTGTGAWGTAVQISSANWNSYTLG